MQKRARQMKPISSKERLERKQKARQAKIGHRDWCRLRAHPYSCRCVYTSEASGGPAAESNRTDQNRSHPLGTAVPRRKVRTYAARPAKE